MGLFSYSDIYGERVWQESRVLVPLDQKQEYYVSALDSQKEVHYSYDKALKDKSYTVYYISENGRIDQEKNVVEISIGEIVEPVCEVYYQKCQSNSWTFAWGRGRYAYGDGVVEAGSSAIAIPSPYVLHFSLKKHLQKRERYYRINMQSKMHTKEVIILLNENNVINSVMDNIFNFIMTILKGIMDFIFMNHYITLLFWYAMVNALAIFLMKKDKQFAQEGKRRMRESTLLMVALAGGAPGMYYAMYQYKHKTLHKKFTIFVPLMIVLHFALLSYMIVNRWVS